MKRKDIKTRLDLSSVEDVCPLCSQKLILKDKWMYFYCSSNNLIDVDGRSMSHFEVFYSYNKEELDSVPKNSHYEFKYDFKRLNRIALEIDSEIYHTADGTVVMIEQNKTIVKKPDGEKIYLDIYIPFNENFEEAFQNAMIIK